VARRSYPHDWQIPFAGSLSLHRITTEMTTHKPGGRLNAADATLTKPEGDA
jgi:hypothetical protein